MRWTYLTEFGWCGFGFEGGLIPELRIGLVRFAYAGASNGSFIDAIKAGVLKRAEKKSD